MSQREELLKEYLKNQDTVHQILVTQGMEFLKADDIWTIIQSELEIEYFEVIHTRLSADSILEIVVRHVNRNGRFLGKVIQALNKEDIDWLPVVSDYIEKAIIQNNGRVWVIHQNDADPHPSMPHAHNYQQNLKLDLYSGKLYRKKTYVGKMKEKERSELVRKIKATSPNIKFKE